jgi:DNA invertase Pin-like site-specific DNA recombinase
VFTLTLNVRSWCYKSVKTPIYIKSRNTQSTYFLWERIMSQNFVGYLRVSTKFQTISISAQRSAIQNHLEKVGGTLVGEFEETESGKIDNRPGLEKALTQARLKGAILITAKLDRLSRSVSFISKLMESNIQFVAADFPEANSLMLHMLASLSQYEREMISKRTKAALSELKKRGVKLGKPENLTDEGRQRGVATATVIRIQKANDYAKDLLPVIDDIKESGITTLTGIAAQLNQMKITTPRGKQFHPNSVRQIIMRNG